MTRAADRYTTYDALCARAAVDAPPDANIAEFVCDRHARTAPDAPAIIHVQDEGDGRAVYSFARLEMLSRAFASVLLDTGLVAGDRVAVLLGQSPEMPIALIACWRLGLVPMPIPAVFSGEGLAHRISHSGARAVVTDRAGRLNLDKLGAAIPRMAAIWVIDTTVAPRDRAFWDDIAKAPPYREANAPGGARAAFMMYTSGTTGKAKGVVHSHAGFFGGMAGCELIHGGIRDDDLAWSPAEWSWIAGFSGLLLAFLYHGRPVIAWRAPHPFDPKRVTRFMADEGVRNSLLTPTMLRLIQQAGFPAELRLRSLMATGEALGPDLYAFCQEQLGLSVSEAYGQTECAPITLNNPALMGSKPGSLGLPAPGMEIELVDVIGAAVADGEIGEIAVHRRHPSVFSGYWRDPAATAQKLRGDWLMTGDEARRDAEGFLWFLGRNDDVIKSSGYRIGPSEIEACLAKHPAVELVGVVGLPHPTRGAEVTAAVKLASGFAPAARLTEELVAFARARLERHEQPRRIVYVDAMPLTVTGKLMRKELQRRLSDTQTLAGR